MGFFADVGPLQVFVSNHVSSFFFFYVLVKLIGYKLIPTDMKFDANGNPPCYSSEDQVFSFFGTIYDEQCLF